MKDALRVLQDVRSCESGTAAGGDGLGLAKISKNAYCSGWNNFIFLSRDLVSERLKAKATRHLKCVAQSAKDREGNLETGELVFHKDLGFIHAMLFQQFPERTAIFSNKTCSFCHVTLRSCQGFGKVILLKSCYGAVLGLCEA